jgi:hypothetical protein
VKAHAQKPTAPQNDATAHAVLHARRAARVALTTHRVEDGGRAASASPPHTAAGFGHDLSLVPAHSNAPLALRPKLAVNAPGDAFEREADRAAELVVSAPALSQPPRTPYRLSHVAPAHAGRVIQRAVVEGVRTDARRGERSPDETRAGDARETETDGEGGKGPDDESKCWEPGRELAPSEVHAACLAADGNAPCPDKTGQPPKPVDASKSPPAPNDPVSQAENVAVNAEVANFENWEDYEYDLIVVPGFTPLDAATAYRMHPDEKARLSRAKKDFDEGKAPFIFVSGGAVYPPGTPCYEGVEMKYELSDMGVPANRIVVDAAAQHSTTNIRNAGRYMLAQKPPLTRALITTTGSQAFFFAHPLISGYHVRSLLEMGHVVGSLKGRRGAGHSAYRPGKRVKRLNERDPQDR